MAIRPGRRRRDVVVAGFAGHPDELRGGLDDPEPSVRAAAFGGLARAGRIDAADIERAASDASPQVRRRAALITAQVADRLPADDLTRVIRRLVDDSEPSVTEVACFAAGELGAAPPELLDAIVTVAIGHDDPLCRESAVAALGAIGDPRGWAGVEHGCRDVVAVRRRAVLALVSFDGDAVPLLMRDLAADHDWQVRQAAEELLAR